MGAASKREGAPAQLKLVWVKLDVRVCSPVFYRGRIRVGIVHHVPVSGEIVAIVGLQAARAIAAVGTAVNVGGVHQVPVLALLGIGQAAFAQLWLRVAPP